MTKVFYYKFGVDTIISKYFYRDFEINDICYVEDHTRQNIYNELNELEEISKEEYLKAFELFNNTKIIL